MYFSVFRELFKKIYIFGYFNLFLRVFLKKIIILIWRIIKNKVLDIKIIFKIFLKILKIS